MAIDESIRIGKLLSHLGLCSRREAADFLSENAVLFQGKQITALNFRVPIEIATELTINKKVYRYNNQADVYLLNKPIGFVCSHKEQKNQQSIFRLLPASMQKLYFAGRLDALSRGLVVLSNQGDLIYNLSHPKFGVEKKYLVHLSRPLSEKEKQQTLSGVYSKNEKLKLFSIKEAKKAAHYFLVLKEGKNREIRRIFQRFRIEVLDLLRTELGKYSVESVAKSGSYVKVSE